MYLLYLGAIDLDFRLISENIKKNVSEIIFTNMQILKQYNPSTTVNITFEDNCSATLMAKIVIIKRFI